MLCQATRAFNFFKLLIIYLAFFFINLSIEFDDSKDTRDSYKRKSLITILAILLIKFFLNIFYIIYLEIKLNVHKRNEYNQRLSNNQNKDKNYLGVFQKIFSEKIIQKIHFETSFFQTQFPIKPTYLFGALTFFLSWVSLILTNFYIFYFFATSYLLYIICLMINVFSGLKCGIKSIQGK